jgi:hypothetical protein
LPRTSDQQCGLVRFETGFGIEAASPAIAAEFGTQALL